MTVYELTIEIDSDTRPERLREIIDRIVDHTFGSSGEVTNFVEVDVEADPDKYYDEDFRTCAQQAEDDHNEGVTYTLGWRSYTRTDGTVWTNPDREED